jgi:hypothetical protein
MPSQFYVTIKLEPHYQQFLRSYFDCDSEIFEFPLRNYFNGLLEEWLTTKRLGQVYTEENDWTFKILLPYFSHKNPTFFRYFAEPHEVLFKREIKRFYDRAILGKMHELLLHRDTTIAGNIQRLDRIAVTNAVIAFFGFDKMEQDSFERLYKLYYRYHNNERSDLHRQRKLLESEMLKNIKYT